MAVADNFKQLLNDFFALYHPRQVKKVDQIVSEFKGQEVEILKTLCDKYKKAYKVIPGLVDALATPVPTPVVEEVPQIEAKEEVVAETPAEEEKEEVVAEEPAKEETSEKVEEAPETVEEEEEK